MNNLTRITSQFAMHNHDNSMNSNSNNHDNKFISNYTVTNIIRHCMYTKWIFYTVCATWPAPEPKQRLQARGREWSHSIWCLVPMQVHLTVFADFWAIIKAHHSDTFPNLITLASIALVFPVHTADVERGFSTQNSLKTHLRNRLSSERLNTIALLKLEGPHWQNFDYRKALVKFRANRDRRGFCLGSSHWLPVATSQSCLKFQFWFWKKKETNSNMYIVYVNSIFVKAVLVAFPHVSCLFREYFPDPDHIGWILDGMISSY